jgi:hypothetical protein
MLRSDHDVKALVACSNAAGLFRKREEDGMHFYFVPAGLAFVHAGGSSVRYHHEMGRLEMLRI